MRTLLVLFACAIVGLAENAFADEGDPMGGAALIREWKALEAVCRGSNNPAACERLNTVGDELGKGAVLQRLWFRPPIGEVLIT